MKEKTIKQWIAQAKSDGKSWAYQASYNLLECNASGITGNLSHALLGAFLWEYTMQGYEYWGEVYKAELNEERAEKPLTK